MISVWATPRAAITATCWSISEMFAEARKRELRNSNTIAETISTMNGPSAGWACS